MADSLTPSPPPAAPGDSRKARLTQVLAALGVVLVVAVVFYFVGRMQGREPVPALEADVTAAEARLEAVRDRAFLNEALALTYRAALDLDARNFGIATGHLRDAARALDSLVVVDGAGLDALRRTMAQTDLTTASDLAQQRAQVLVFAEEIEALRQDRSAPAPAPPAE